MLTLKMAHLLQIRILDIIVSYGIHNATQTSIQENEDITQQVCYADLDNKTSLWLIRLI